VAPPVRRVYIPKDERGATRPIGIPAFEDKVLQRAIAMVLDARCTSKTSSPARMASAHAAPRTRCCKPCGRR
jgi:retron-type reverse transcriptase